MYLPGYRPIISVMRARPSFSLALLLVAFCASPALAEGYGGILFGLSQPSWNPRFLPSIPASMPDFEYMGGYGGGITDDGMIIGGFGLAILDYASYDKANWSSGSSVPRHIVGGVGGLLLGSRLAASRYAHIDLAARLGLGGMGVSDRQPAAGAGYEYSSSGYALAYAEPYLELGLSPLPWMRISAELSYPIFGNFIPGRPFGELLYYTPVLALGVTFGSY